MNKYKVELEFPLDPNVESGLYNEDVFVFDSHVVEYGATEIWVETKLTKEELEGLLDIKRIIE